EYRDSIHVAEWRHSAKFTVREEVAKFVLAREPDILGVSVPFEFFQAELIWRRNYAHDGLTVIDQHDTLGHLFAGNMDGVGNFLSGQSPIMTQNLVLYLVIVQKLLDLSRQRHKSFPFPG